MSARPFFRRKSQRRKSQTVPQHKLEDNLYTLNECKKVPEQNIYPCYQKYYYGETMRKEPIFKKRRINNYEQHISFLPVCRIGDNKYDFAGYLRPPIFPCQYNNKLYTKNTFIKD